MSLTGTSKRQAAPTPAPTIRLKDLLSQLDSEWATLKQDSVELHGLDEAGLLAYYHCAVRVALPWVGGDVTAFPFPEAYAGERLHRLACYLRALDPEQYKAVRNQQVAHLRAVWPAYAEQCTGFWQEAEMLTFTWDGVDRLWQTPESAAQDQNYYLPKFACKASEDFHLVALAVCTLNRLLRYSLTDLYPHPTDDGRN